MKLELLKLIVQPVLLERDDDGIIIGEKIGEPTALYSFEQFIMFRTALEQQLVEQQREEVNGAGELRADDEHHLRQPELPG